MAPFPSTTFGRVARVRRLFGEDVVEVDVGDDVGVNGLFVELSTADVVWGRRIDFLFRSSVGAGAGCERSEGFSIVAVAVANCWGVRRKVTGCNGCFRNNGFVELGETNWGKIIGVKDKALSGIEASCPDRSHGRE